MTDSLWIYPFYALVLAVPLFFYIRQQKKREARAKEAAEKAQVYSEGPKSQHPHIDSAQCIGCQACTSVCPEGDVLAMLGGKAVIVNGYKCIGHGLCFEACPVGAITMVLSSPSISADLPSLTQEHETNVPNLFIIGELGGLALVKNAVNQGRDCIDTVVKRLALSDRSNDDSEVYDVLIVGAGPAGISASLRAIENNLRYVTIERDEIGGTVAKFPRQKLVLTSPVEFPMFGKFKKTELSKEDLLAFWRLVMERADFKAHSGENVEDIHRNKDGSFVIMTDKAEYRSRAVIMALGRAGTPRKLGVKGEELPKVMYRLIEADHYINKKILIVGGGDSAIEAAMGLAHQQGNNVTLSYRGSGFHRIKERNARKLEEFVRAGKVDLLLNSVPVEFTESHVRLSVDDKLKEVANDYVWIFAGGVPPNDFLRKIGVDFGTRDITLEATGEARIAIQGKKQGVLV